MIKIEQIEKDSGPDRGATMRCDVAPEDRDVLLRMQRQLLRMQRLQPEMQRLSIKFGRDSSPDCRDSQLRKVREDS